MKSVPVSRLSNDALICELKDSVAHDGLHTARQVALIAEVERRRLYAPAGFPSMFAFCVEELHLSEDAAYKRIRVARASRRYPGVLEALAEGRVHLSGLTMLAHYFKHAPTEELIAAATYKSKQEIEKLLAERFPKADLPALVRALPPVAPPGLSQPQVTEVVSEPFEQLQVVAESESELAPGPVGCPVIPGQTLAEGAPSPPGERAHVTPLAPQRYGVQFTLDQAGRDLLERVRNLLGNRVPPGDLAEVIVRALEAYAAQLEKQKFAATEKPSRAHRPCKPGSRHISARVKRKVWKRDKGRCTYVAENGKRCESRWDLEFDHEHEYARGGEASVANIRLRCPAHNQHGAERTYGVEFMEHKRASAAEARERAAAERERGAAERERPSTPAPAP
jgi:5-methylcytosine-specific restriction endonuclease McrA